MDSDSVVKMVDQMEKDVIGIRQEALKMSWYMRGGVTLQDLLHIYSSEDREILYKVIQDNVDLTIQAKMPLL